MKIFIVSFTLDISRCKLQCIHNIIWRKEPSLNYFLVYDFYFYMRIVKLLSNWRFKAWNFVFKSLSENYWSLIRNFMRYIIIFCRFWILILLRFYLLLCMQSFALTHFLLRILWINIWNFAIIYLRNRQLIYNNIVKA